ncbi:MAG: hypothetical protein R2698_12065 [Microthrixaceae bacterium]
MTSSNGAERSSIIGWSKDRSSGVWMNGGKNLETALDLRTRNTQSGSSITGSANTARPPGRSARYICFAAGPSSKWCATVRPNTRSTLSSSIPFASSTGVQIVVIRSATPLRRARSSTMERHLGEMSVAITSAPCNANQTVSSPKPEPVSSTRVPSRGRDHSMSCAIGSSNWWLCGIVWRSINQSASSVDASRSSAIAS